MKSEFQKQCEEESKKRAKTENYFVQTGEYKGFLKGNINAFENELEFHNKRYCQCGCCVDVIQKDKKLEERINQLKKDIEYAKKELKNLK